MQKSLQDLVEMEVKSCIQHLPEDRQLNIENRALEIIKEKYMVLSRELTLIDGWSWLPGMMALRWNPNGLYHGRKEIRIEGEREFGIVAKWGCVPDLQDAATLGAIIQLIRELWKDQRICNVFDSYDETWCCGVWDDGLILRGKPATTEAESLLNCVRNYNLTCRPNKGVYIPTVEESSKS